MYYEISIRLTKSLKTLTTTPHQNQFVSFSKLTKPRIEHGFFSSTVQSSDPLRSHLIFFRLSNWNIISTTKNATLKSITKRSKLPVSFHENANRPSFASLTIFQSAVIQVALFCFIYRRTIDWLFFMPFSHKPPAFLNKILFQS